MKSLYLRLKNSRLAQDGINMVDLMMWLVIAALLLAAAIQSIGYYQKSAYVYQMREAVDVAASRIMAVSAMDGSVDYEDAVEIIDSENAARANDEITLHVENINMTAAGEAGDGGFELASATTAAPGAGETFYIKATHTAVTDKEVAHYFKDTSSKKVGTHLEERGNSSEAGNGETGNSETGGNTGDTGSTPEESPSPSPSATPTPTPTPTPTETAAPANNFATLTLSQQENSQGLNYYGMASSADGSIIYAGSNVGNIYRSADSGITWTALTSAGSRGWYGIATNAAGTKIVATSNTGFVYISNDSGATWTQTSLASQTWVGAAMSPDGTKILTAFAGSTTDGNLYLSTDGGTTWIAQKDAAGAVISSRWRNVDLSDDGTTLVAASLSTSQIWKSTNSGTSWARTGPAWTAGNAGVAISANGQTITIGQANGGIETTVNGGTSWHTKASGINSDYYRMAMSADGTKIVATGSSGDATATPNAVYTSTDSGETWVHHSTMGTAQWFTPAMSADGKKLVFGNLSGRKIWTGVWGPEVVEPAAGPVTSATVNWNAAKTVGTGDVYDIAASADGTKIVMAEFNDAMKVSSDSGATWTSMAGTTAANRRSVAISGNGGVVLMGRDSGSPYFSTNNGTTWTVAKLANGTDVPASGGWYVAMSADSTKMFASVAGTGTMYYSTNSGATWTQGGSMHGHKAADLTASEDGSVLLAGGDNQQVLKSTDYGQTWNYVDALPLGQWFSIDISANGTRMAAADFLGGVWVSQNSGATWKKMPVPVNASWRSVTISDDGTRIAAARNNGSIYTSKDSGATWTEHASQGASNWRAMFGNADGTKLFVGGSAGKLATAQYQ